MSSNKEYLISVKLKDIMKGVREDGESCAVARAARRVFHRKVEVDGEQIFVDSGDYGQVRVFNLPKRAKQFIKRFDDRGKVKPFSFSIS